MSSIQTFFQLDRLAAEYETGRSGIPIVYSYAEGFFIYAGADQDDEHTPVYADEYKEAGMSEAFLNILAETTKAGMAYLNLDADAPSYDELPYFDGEEEEKQDPL